MTDDVTNMSLIEYVIQTFNMFILLLHSNLTQNLAFWQVLIRVIHLIWQGLLVDQPA